VISSRTEPDDAASPPLSVDDVDRTRARPRLQRIARKNSTADASTSSPPCKQTDQPAQIEAASGPASGPPKSGLTRVARKTDSTSEKRRKKLARIRAELANRKSQDNGNESVLANRVTEAIRQSSAENASSTPQKKTKRKKKRKTVCWVLDPKAIEQTLDSRITAGSNSSDAQAVSSDALHAELELRRMLALSTANFQLDACPTFSVASTPQPDYSSPTAVAEVHAAVRPVAQARKTPVETPTSALESISVDPPANDLDVDFAHAMQAVASPGLSLVETAKKPVEPYGDWFKRVVVRNRWLTWFTTFYIHWIVLLLLAAIIVHGPEEAAELLLNAAFATEEDTTTAPFEMTVPVEEIEPVVELEPEAVSVPADEAPQELEEEQLDISESILNEMAPQGVAAAEKSASSEASESNTATGAVATQHVDRAPAVATRQGSFSVWTEPSNPRPGDPYRIIIQVRLPEKTKKYLVTDLEGVVVGSDGYRKPIPGFATGELPIVDGYARLAVPIVSADKKVRDTVFIRSRLLRETQKLLVEF